MRVFVLTTGRSASKTFARACEAISGMTAGHETRTRLMAGRLNYPDNHIEVDNRLVWFLGGLNARYSDDETFYVHLVRDKQSVARSYLERWHIKVSVVRAFYHAILMNPEKPTAEEAHEACHLYVDTVHENIDYFLSTRKNWVTVNVDSFYDDFCHFMDVAGLQGDKELLSKLVASRQNASRKRSNGLMRKLYSKFSSRRLYIK